MSGKATAYVGGLIFDGESLLEGRAARFRGGELEAVIPRSEVKPDEEAVDLEGDILSPGYVDLQVNGGGGIMFNDDPSPEALSRIASAHRRLGTARFLPTLISDSPEKTREAIAAAREAIRGGVPGVAGLHLEGPHLSLERKGAHDPERIRPMTEQDMKELLEAVRALPALMVTLAPESASLERVATLSKAGVIVSLGHSGADCDACLSYARAGAKCVTHLFNAMSQLQSREPGLVGAALSCGSLSAGLIADGEHVHPDAIRAAWNAKSGPGRIFLVSDSMAVAGTDLREFQLQGRRVFRRGGRLALDDGTLAGADLDMTGAIRILAERCGIAPERSLPAATAIPAKLIGQSVPLAESDFIRISPDLSATRIAAQGSESDSPRLGVGFPG